MQKCDKDGIEWRSHSYTISINITMTAIERFFCRIEQSLMQNCCFIIKKREPSMSVTENLLLNIE